MRYIIILLILFCSCTATNKTKCDNASYSSSYQDGYSRYLFEENVLPYEGYSELNSFAPNKAEVNVVDSVVSSSGLSLSKVKFAQYNGFVTNSGERIVAVIYVYSETKEFPQARCSWFYGLGDYFEENTRERFVNISTKMPFELK